MECILRHGKDHKDSACGYWVCAYGAQRRSRRHVWCRRRPTEGPRNDAMCPRTANNQWKLGEELVDELSQTSFRRALQLAKGTVSILDCEGKVFTRVWCCYEVRRRTPGARPHSRHTALVACIDLALVHHRSTSP